jgi:hypothetical protein
VNTKFWFFGSLLYTVRKYLLDCEISRVVTLQYLNTFSIDYSRSPEEIKISFGLTILDLSRRPKYLGLLFYKTKISFWVDYFKSAEERQNYLVSLLYGTQILPLSHKNIVFNFL